MKTTLKQCPWCGCGEDSLMIVDGAVYCFGCRQYGPESSSDNAAAIVWNKGPRRRPQPKWNRRVQPHPTGKALRGWVWVGWSGKLSFSLSRERILHRYRPRKDGFVRATLTLDAPEKPSKKGKAKR